MTTVEFLADRAIRSLILIATGTLLLWLLKVKDASIRAVAWTAMLCGSLAIPALTLAFPKTLLPTIRPTVAGVVIRPAEVPVGVSEVVATPVPSAEPPGSVSGYGARSVRLDPPVTYPFEWMRVALDVLCGNLRRNALLRIYAGLLGQGLRLFGRSRPTGQATGEVGDS